MTTHLINYVMERSRHRRELLTRWDNRELDAYGGYVDRVRAGIFLAVQFYEHREGLRRSEHSEAEMIAELAEAERHRGRSFEQIMLLGGDEVVEAAHELNAAALAVDWQATGKTVGIREINQFHEAVRADLGVQGKVTGDNHPARNLLLPSARRDDAASS
ncbi:hypothetical protein [Streptomyces sp. NPDC059479]|uniref:hypothetical protein n=1 Tax=Streptomyces sp. NPDC059479 TaxID=3346848 RepID=UPI003673897C